MFEYKSGFYINILTRNDIVATNRGTINIVWKKNDKPIIITEFDNKVFTCIAKPIGEITKEYKFKIPLYGVFIDIEKDYQEFLYVLENFYKYRNNEYKGGTII